MTASLFVPLPSSLKPLHVLSVLFLALPTAPATPPPQPYSSLHMGSSAPGRTLSHDAYMRVMLRWDPLRSGNALGLFPTLVLCCREPGITTESSYHSKAFLTDSNHCQAIGYHRQWGYAIISDWLEQWVSSCELPKLFMAEQRSRSSTIGNYRAHSSPPPLHSICGQSVGGFG